jgi:hypothetical protein
MAGRSVAKNQGARAVARAASPQQPGIIDRRLQRLMDYWEKGRGARALPARSDINPGDLRFLLGHLILLDVMREPLRFRVRLQGTEVEWWTGGDLTGRTVDQLSSPTLASVAQEHLAASADSARPCHRIGEQKIADVPRRYEALILPLAADGKTVNMLLAAVVCQGGHAAA